MTRLDATTLARLQLVQNASARLLMGLCKFTRITPVLASLHWLPVWFRVELKILVTLLPHIYLNCFSLHNPSRALNSGNSVYSSQQSKTTRSKLKQRGERACAVLGPKLWNSLPVHIRSVPTLQIFKSLLKTHYFSIAFNVS